MSKPLQVFINQQAVELPIGASLADAVQHVKLQPPFAAAVNLQFVPKQQYAPVSYTHLTLPTNREV